MLLDQPLPVRLFSGRRSVILCGGVRLRPNDSTRGPRRNGATRGRGIIPGCSIDRGICRLVLGRKGKGTLDPADIHVTHDCSFLQDCASPYQTRGRGRGIIFSDHSLRTRTSAIEHCDGGPRMTLLFARQSSDAIHATLQCLAQDAYIELELLPFEHGARVSRPSLAPLALTHIIRNTAD
jgi:hypothetical protein